MSDFYEEIVRQRGSLERLVGRMPGFRGYQDKRARRKADTMLRDHVTGLIKQCIDKMVRIEKAILDNSGMEHLTRTRDVKARIQLLHDKVRAAAPGYSGMWAQMKIEPEELEKIYSFDEALIPLVDKIDVALDSLEQAALDKKGVDKAIAQVDTVATEALEAFRSRDDVLTKFSKEL